MRSLVRYAFSIGAAAALLSGCGAQSPIGAPGTLPQTRVVAAQADGSPSWMLPEAKGERLLYVSAPVDQAVYVYSLPSSKLVGKLRHLVSAAGMCSDKAGHVWITLDVGLGRGAIVEYAHGGTLQLAKLHDLDPPWQCSVDPTTGNLAVAPDFGQRGIAVYIKARGSAQYHHARDAGPWDCAYDNSGNLFVAATIGPQYASRVYWLPKGGVGIVKYGIDPAEFADNGVAWDGHYLVVNSNGEDLYQYAGHNEVGETVLKGGGIDTVTSWIHGSTLLVGAADEVAFFAYPSGGYPLKTLKLPYNQDGITVSI